MQFLKAPQPQAANDLRRWEQNSEVSIIVKHCFNTASLCLCFSMARDGEQAQAHTCEITPGALDTRQQAASQKIKKASAAKSSPLQQFFADEL